MSFAAVQFRKELAERGEVGHAEAFHPHERADRTADAPKESDETLESVAQRIVFYENLFFRVDSDQSGWISRHTVCKMVPFFEMSFDYEQALKYTQAVDVMPSHRRTLLQVGSHHAPCARAPCESGVRAPMTDSLVFAHECAARALSRSLAPSHSGRRRWRADTLRVCVALFDSAQARARRAPHDGCEQLLRRARAGACVLLDEMARRRTGRRGLRAASHTVDVLRDARMALRRRLQGRLRQGGHGHQGWPGECDLHAISMPTT